MVGTKHHSDKLFRIILIDGLNATFFCYVTVSENNNTV